MSPQTEVLLVDDNPADIALVQEAIAGSAHPCHTNSVMDGEEALAFLRKEGQYSETVRPDLVVLDLNLPKKDGCEVLAEMRASPVLMGIPVVIFSSSSARADIVRSYEMGANCYVSKPTTLKSFFLAVHAIEDFWFGMANLPNKESDGSANN
ncbi:MAG TPA: response regulator [Candidatus Aquilonibacter sp.]|nr:response regulator [Candidatus Aquilonibacter sp.]